MSASDPSPAPSEVDRLIAGGTSGTPHAAVDEPRGTRLDDWWGRMLATPARARLWRWGGPAFVLLVAAVLRLWNLAHPQALVFDETYYVKDAYTLMRLGYEGSWGEDANEQFAGGNPDVYSTDPSFVAHPPLGKWIIAAGLAAFGAENPVGWRLSTAVVGLLVIAVTMAVAWALFRSTLLTVIAGGLLAIDGNAIVMSRVALLDGSLTLLALLGVAAVLLDRRWTRRRLDLWVLSRTDAGKGLDWGPALWWRPWLMVAGLAFGLAIGVKWSGLYFLAALAVYTLVVDAVARRRAGVPFWATGTVLKQGPVSFLLTVPIAAVAYLATWTGWFATDGGYFRHWVEEGNTAWGGLLAWVPVDLQNWWHYQATMYNYHVGENRPHGYQANPLTWLLMIRPTSMYWRSVETGDDGCTADLCGQSITGIANPLIWWAATAACLYLVYRLARYREWRVGFILIALAAGYLPWLLYLGRTVFQFYTIAFEPYLVLGLVAVIGIILGSRHDPTWRRLSGIRLVAIYLGFCVLVSAFFLPLWTGAQVPWWFIQLHYWLPGWR
ncbi:protein-O-mannosyltransferase-like protein [Diaminobutyricimonas aerilata]|uniref:Polyprenol-phosphate-mannose--protein mannosyltransferase n=1 Tax=Diaminobutyricimonas aerilata TaxID=1162967 RepID=A0A2M9CHT3_9MICO|nr:phospholipid carrier-dependent glycosyltransferase [Diaminobutyricimonas aerilata]PJJ71415.1 protein-O-mannosyltransferase-like protein [Diaminobutyricimonas aerilata]